jgi:hypothetical protein
MRLYPRQRAGEAGRPELRALDEDHDGEAEGVEDERRPDEGLSSGFFDVDAADPEGGRDGDKEGAGKHYGAHHADGVRVPDEAAGNEEARCEVKGHEGRVRVLECGGHVCCEAEQTG